MYFLDDEEFYTNKYAEEIQALEEAVRNSVRREILDEMNRLKRENEELQDVKERFEAIKADYARKKEEYDRAIFRADHDARNNKLEKILADHRIIKWKINRVLAYGPKCDKCNESRNIKVTLPSGRVIDDRCQCWTESEYCYYPTPYALHELSDKYGITAFYQECGSDGKKYYVLNNSLSICDDSMQKKIENWKNNEMGHEEAKRLLFDSKEECQSACDVLNAKRKHQECEYRLNGELIKEDLENE